MRLLLDTHALLWASGAPERLSAAARAALLADENDISFSIVSLWEIAIKTSLQRLDLASNWRVLIDEGRKRLGARWLPIDETHCGRLQRCLGITGIRSTGCSSLRRCATE